MKAIQVKYLAPKVRGSRFKASAQEWKSVTEPMDYALNPEVQARNMAWAMWCDNATDGEHNVMAQGTLPNGDYVFCFI